MSSVVSYSGSDMEITGAKNQRPVHPLVWVRSRVLPQRAQRGVAATNGLEQKHRYLPSARGRQVIAALMIARQTDTAKLVSHAA